MKWVTGLVQGGGSDVGIINLDPSPQQIGLLAISHGTKDFIVQKPGRIIVNAQIATELKRRNSNLGLADQIKGQKPDGE